ncbi:MAG: hypothetical protein ACE5NM_01345 [Sedimentisphaerales bacterium]
MRTLRRLKCYAVLMSLSWTVVCVGAVSPESVKEEIRSRLASLQNITVHYKVKTTYTPPQKDVERVRKINDARKSASTTTVILSGSDKRDTTFSFLRGKARYENKFVETNYAGEIPERPKLEVQAFPGSRAELLTKDAYLGYRGIITERILLPDAEVEVGLGLRGCEQNGWLADALLEEMSVTVLDEKTASLEYVDPKRVKHCWLVDQKLGCAATMYERRILTRRNNILNHVMTMEDFRKVDGLMLPHKMTLRALNKPGEEPPILAEKAIEVIEYKLNDPQNIPERYHIKWPEGTIVHDRILETTYMSDGTGLQPQGYISRKTLDPESILLKPVGGNVTSIRKSTHKELFIPNVQFALKKNKSFILDLAHVKLLTIPADNELYSEKIYKHLINSGRGDLAWDGSLVTLRRAKALTVRQESNQPLRCTPGRWCNWDRLPEKVKLPYRLLVVTDEDVDYLVNILEIKSDGIRISYKKLDAAEAKRYYPIQKKRK